MATHIITSPLVTPIISFGTSPHHAQVSGPDGIHSAAYCYLTEKDKTMSEAYDLYYKGSLIHSLDTVCHEMEGRETKIAIAGNENITYERLYQRVCSVGRGFAELGLQRWEKAILYMTPSDATPLEWLLSCYGLWSHHMMVVVAGSEGQLADAVRETRARAVVTTAKGAEAAAKALEANAIPNACVVLTTGDQPIIANYSTIHTALFKDMEAHGAACHAEQPRTMYRPEPDQQAMIVYSFETPGRGIVLTHGNLHAAITVTTPRLVALAGSKEALRTAIVEPMSHLTPFVLASACLIAGGKITFGITEVAAFGPTIVACTPSNYNKVAAALALENGNAKDRIILQYNFPKEATSGSVSHEATPVDLTPSTGFWYSPMVASGVGLMHFLHQSAATVTLLPGTEMRLRHLSTDTVDMGTPKRAEIMLKGPCVSKGYYSPDKELDELDRSVLRDGWMPTGDLVEISSKGDIRIIGRLSKSEET